MSFTSNFLAKLAEFDALNTGTFYPELAKIKYLLLDSNRANTFIYTYSGNTNNFTNILLNLQKLFPNMFIYYNTTNSQDINDGAVKYLLNAQINSSNSSDSSVYTMFISSTLISNSTIVFSYTTTESVPTFNSGDLPLTFLPGVFEQVGSPDVSTNVSTVTVTVNCLYNNASILETDYGLSFLNKLNNANVTNIKITTLNNIPLFKAGYQFQNLTTLSITRGQNPIIRSGTSLLNCFKGCTNFNSNISGWNTAGVTNMANCFFGCSYFNSDISDWNTDGVTNMEYCFYRCTNFNSDISDWNTAGVTNMEYCFNGCRNFNNGGAVGNGAVGIPLTWTASSNASLSNCFYGCTNFNCNVNSLITTGVTSMEACFRGCGYFNNGAVGNNTGAIGNDLTWTTTSALTSLKGCFYGCNNFNCNVNSLITTGVTSMEACFYNCNSFNNGGNIGNGAVGNPLTWTTTALTNLYGCFQGCTNFNSDISGWNTASVTTMQNCFNNAGAFNCGVNNWNIDNITNNNYASLNGTLEFSFTTKATLLSTMLLSSLIPLVPLTYVFTINTNSTIINTSTSMNYQFNENAVADKTYTFTIYTTYNMISGTYGLKFTEIQINWLNNNTTGVSITKLFNIPLHNAGNQFGYNTQAQSGLKLSIVERQNPIIRSNTSLQFCFNRCTAFNSDISGWNTAGVRDMSFMFSGIPNSSNNYSIDNMSLFDQSIGNWNTSNVTDMKYMFSNCTFNQPIDSWDTSNVTIMTSMFGFGLFNQPIGSWNTSKVTNMDVMFISNLYFNQDISNWDTSNVTNISGMFYRRNNNGNELPEGSPTNTPFNNGNSKMKWTLPLLNIGVRNNYLNWRNGSLLLNEHVPNILVGYN
jgi:surface protein